MTANAKYENSKGKSVNRIKKQLENKLQFWAVLGPCIIILTLLISLIKFSPESFYLPLAIIVGVPACWMWKLRGMLGSITLLLFLLLVSFGSIDADERLWHIGVAAAISLSFVVGTLSSEEVASLIQRLQSESKSRLEHLLRIDEKLKELTLQMDLEREEAALCLRNSKEETENAQREITLLHRASKAAKGDLARFTEEKSFLLEELFENKKMIAELNRSLEISSEQTEDWKAKCESSHDDREKAYIKEVEEGKILLLEREELLREREVELSEIKAILEQNSGDTAKREETEAGFNSILATMKRELQENHFQLRELEETAKAKEGFFRKQLEDRDYQLYIQVRRHAESQKKLLLQQKLLEEWKGRKGSLEEKLEAMDGRLLESTEIAGHNRLLRDELNRIRTEKFQLSLDFTTALDTVARYKEGSHKIETTQSIPNEKFLGEKREKKSSEVLPDEVVKLRRTAALYKQLKNQFEQKSESLHSTRGELFKKENELLSLEKEREMSGLEVSIDDKILEAELRILEEEKEKALFEVEMLSDLVAALLDQSHVDWTNINND
ncbi:MAG: hypothetical protein ACI9S8_002206 [Chlamydiales bacterium]